MSQVGVIRLDDVQMECLVAALLTVASLGSTLNNKPEETLRRYSEFYTQLQTINGAVVQKV
jgi:hypothetical protein